MPPPLMLSGFNPGILLWVFFPPSWVQLSDLYQFGPFGSCLQDLSGGPATPSRANDSWLLSESSQCGLGRYGPVCIWVETNESLLLDLEFSTSWVCVCDCFLDLAWPFPDLNSPYSYVHRYSTEWSQLSGVLEGSSLCYLMGSLFVCPLCSVLSLLPGSSQSWKWNIPKTPFFPPTFRDGCSSPEV